MEEIEKTGLEIPEGPKPNPTYKCGELKVLTMDEASQNMARAEYNMGPRVLCQAMFESGGKAPKIGCDPKQIDWLAYRRSRVGIFNSSFFDTMGVQEYNDFEKLVYFLSRSILEESIGRSAKHDFRQFNMTKIELPGASEAGTTVEDLLDDKKYDWIAEKCIKHGITNIEELSRLTTYEWNDIDIPIRFSQLKPKSQKYMDESRIGIERAQYWMAVGNRQLRHERGRNFNFPGTAEQPSDKEPELTSL